MSHEFEIPVAEAAPFRDELDNSAFSRDENSGGEVQPCDFRNPGRLPANDLQRLRRHQEKLAVKLASRFSGLLRIECSLRLESVEIVPGRSLASIWPTPGHLARFKIEPLRGVALLEFGSQLGSGMIDRLLGGRGTGSAEANPLSDVEVVLFEQIGRLFTTEWCAHWSGIAELKPVLLGYESNSRFRQIAAPQGPMLAITFEMAAGPCSGQIHFGLLFDSVAPLVKKLSGDPAQKVANGAKISPNRNPVSEWKESFGEVPVSVTAEWPAAELTARELLALKVGDVLRMGAERAQDVHVRLADELKFQGRPGTLAGQWAVELTRVIV